MSTVETPASILRELLDEWEVGGTPRERIIRAWELLTGEKYVEQLIGTDDEPTVAVEGR